MWSFNQDELRIYDFGKKMPNFRKYKCVINKSVGEFSYSLKCVAFVFSIAGLSGCAIQPEISKQYISKNQIEANYVSNGTFGKYWDLTINESGQLNAKSGDYLSFSGEATDNILLDNFSLSEFCSYDFVANFFSLPSTISPEFVPMDGPSLYLSIVCSGEVHVVRLRDDIFNTNIDSMNSAHVKDFREIWDYLWSHTEINPY